jgi:hypothetical protein
VWRILENDVSELISISVGLGRCTLIQFCPTPLDSDVTVDAYKSRRPIIAFVEVLGDAQSSVLKFYSLSETCIVKSIKVDNIIQQVKASVNYVAVVF